jgi:hypothetical protein
MEKLIEAIQHLHKLNKNEIISNDEYDEKINTICKWLMSDSIEESIDDEYLENIFSLDKEINKMKDYLEKYTIRCKICKKKVIYEELLNFRERNLDCASTDWTIGCCCCGNGNEYHKPECTQFICHGECENKWREYRNEYTSRQPCSSTYGKSTMLISDSELDDLMFSQ